MPITKGASARLCLFHIDCKQFGFGLMKGRGIARLCHSVLSHILHVRNDCLYFSLHVYHELHAAFEDLLYAIVTNYHLLQFNPAILKSQLQLPATLCVPFFNAARHSLQLVH